MNPIRHLKMHLLGCTKSLALVFAILLPFFVEAQLNVNITGISPTCNGYTNGSVTANVSGGVSPYTYSWNTGANSNSILSIGAGSYSVTVTDNTGAQANASFTLTQPSAVSVSISTGNPCTNAGNATATASGGNGGYSYLWDTGANTASVSGLSSGLHCVTVTDNNGCQAVSCAVIAGALDLDLLVQGLACFNFCDASVEAIVTGGAPPYTYLWSNGATGSVNPNLGPGTYSVTVTDQNGCTITGSTPVGNPIPITVNLTVVNPACGAGNTTGSATVAPTGGTSPYVVNWSTGAIGNTVTGLLPGNYSVTVTDFLGCTESAAVVVIPQSSIFLNATATPAAVCGSPTGTATVTASGGVAPYTYLWNNGGTTATISNLAPGNYTVVVTDSQGCGATAQVTVGGIPGIDLHITGVNGGCAANGSANAMVTPGTGTPPYSFLWNTGATTPVINNLTAGTYTVTVTDANGCTAVDQVTVSGTSNLSVSATGVAVKCFNGNNGSATATATGATGTVTYQWSNGGTNQTISNLSAGTYFVTVTDQGSGCTAFTSAFVSQPTQMSVTVTSVNGQCLTLGSATAVASGGTPGYTYAWSNGGSSSTISNLNTGAYAVTATDANGCAVMGMTSVNNGSNVLTVSITIVTPITIVGGTTGALATVVSGGTAPYTYQWNIGANTPNISGLPAGTYTVNVTSADGCNGMATIVLNDPPCVNITDPGTICCNQYLCGPGNDPAPITSVTPATGGSGTLQYLWMYSTIAGPFNPNYWNAIPSATGPSYDPGPINETTYFVRCARRGACQWLESNQIVITVGDEAVAEISGPDFACVGDQATYAAASSGPGAQYFWNFGPWASPQTSFSQNPTVTWLQAGVVYVKLTVTRNGCTSTDEMGVSISNSPILCGTAIVINVNNMQTAVSVEWETAHVPGDYEYAVQRSTDGVNFSNLAILPQSQELGLYKYSFTDYFPKKGNAFYRVEILENGEHMKYSGQELVQRFDSKQNFMAYPNPVNDVLSLESKANMETNITVEVLNMQGKLIELLQIDAATLNKSINLSHLQGGTYLLRLRYNNGMREIIKFVKS